MRNAAMSRIVKAFLAHSPASCRNDRTDGKTLFFHGSPIATHLANGQMSLSCCGHNKPSTRLRLNEVCALTGNGRPFHSKNFTLFFGESEASDPTIISIQKA